MAEAEFDVACPHCGVELSVPVSMKGQRSPCPNCKQTLLLRPRLVLKEPEQSVGHAVQQPIMPECPGCGMPMPHGAVICTGCGLDLRTGAKFEEQPQRATTQSSAKVGGGTIVMAVVLVGLFLWGQYACEEKKLSSSGGMAGSASSASTETEADTAYRCVKQIILERVPDPESVTFKGYTVLDSAPPKYLLKVKFTAPNKFGAIVWGYALCSLKVNGRDSFTYDRTFGFDAFASEEEANEAVGVCRDANGWRRQ